MPKKNSTASSVSDYMQQLDHPLKAEVEALRQIILGADGQIEEAVKWNAPSFFVKEHFATFNLHYQDVVQIVFHRGAKVMDTAVEPLKISEAAGLLEWVGKDRAIARFASMDDVTAKRDALADIVKQWVEGM